MSRQTSVTRLRRNGVLAALLVLALAADPAPAARAVGSTTERVSVPNIGGEASHASDSPAISADGRYVAFASDDDLATGEFNVGRDVFVRDRVAGTTEWV